MSKRESLITAIRSIQQKIQPLMSNDYYRKWLIGHDEISLNQKTLSRSSILFLGLILEDIKEIEKTIGLIEVIRGSKGGIWFGESPGHGACSLYYIGDEGLSCGPIQTSALYEPCQMTEAEYHEALKQLNKIDNGNYDYKKCRPAIMVKGGCKPGKTYFILDRELRYSDEIEYYDKLEDLLDYSAIDFEPLGDWVDMGLGDLEKWADAAMKIKRGIHSYGRPVWRRRSRSLMKRVPQPLFY